MDVPLLARFFQCLIGPHRALAGSTPHRKLHRHDGQAQNDQKEQVEQHKCAAAALTGNIRELPHVADADEMCIRDSTIRVVSCYADIVAMRHPKEGAPLRASRYSRIPVINAGDGGHQHPTQTLTDLMTIRRRMGRLDDLTIGLCGDLKFGRTVHSLIKTMARCKNIRFVLISPEELRVPDYIVKDVLEANGIPYQAVSYTHLSRSHRRCSRTLLPDPCTGLPA